MPKTAKRKTATKKKQAKPQAVTPDALDIRSLVILHLTQKVGKEAAIGIIEDYTEVQLMINQKRHNTSWVQRRKGMKLILARMGVTDEMLTIIQGQIRTDKEVTK